MRPAVILLGPSGEHAARQIVRVVKGQIHRLHRDGGCRAKADEIGVDDLASHLFHLFQDGRTIIGVCAAGILIRLLAPALTDKREEPPVLCVSEDGESIVPLLGGHHGANQLARKIASVLGGQAAITTAGDVRFGVALDDPPDGWSLADPDKAKSAMAALLGGATARIEGEMPGWLVRSRLTLGSDGNVAIRIGVAARGDQPSDLTYHPHRLALGVGCERGCDPQELETLVRRTLSEANLAPKAIACVVSIDVKADETAVHELASVLGRPARFLAPDVLEAETPRLANPSDLVFREVGAHGVAEAAALAAAGPNSDLLVTKTKSKRATCAVALAPDIINPDKVGRSRGRLSVVGLGPGSEQWLSPEARMLLEQSDVVVGYGLYLELIARLIDGKEKHQSGLGQEAERVRMALRLAAEGRQVALVSSGDAGIYALATLVFETLDSGTAGDAEKRIEIRVAPGLTAMQAAAARIGAPLGHDFCAISLSDLLTPWPAIETRIEAAARADFVIAFYNPVSKRRRTQLAAAKSILLQHRPAETPVVLARNLGRQGEDLRTISLANLDVDQVDMLTLVLVGASTTRNFKLGERSFVYTPRGYAVDGLQDVGIAEAEQASEGSEG